MLLKLGLQFVDALTVRDFLSLECFDFAVDSLLIGDQARSLPDHLLARLTQFDDPRVSLSDFVGGDFAFLFRRRDVRFQLRKFF